MKKNKKINILFDYSQVDIQNSTKGDTIHAYNLAKLLSKKINLYSIRPKSNPKIISMETGVIFLYKKFLKNKMLINSLLQLTKIVLSKININLCYIRVTYSIFKRPGYWYSIISRTPFIVEINGISWEEKKGFFYKNKTVRKLILAPLKKARGIICVSTKIKDCIQKEIFYPENKIYVVENGVDVNLFKIKNKNEINKIKKYLKINNQKNIILFSGVIEKWQGVKYIIPICKELIKKNNKIIFIIAGDGSLLSSIKQEANNNNLNKHFIFTGRVAHNIIADYTSVADICIAPFKKNRKASPIKIFEYLACGKNVVSTPIEDIKKLNLKGVYFVSPKNYIEFAQNIYNLLNNKNLTEKFEIRQQIIENYTWEKTAKKIIKIINNSVS